MGEFLFRLFQSFMTTMVTEIGKVLAKRLFSEKGKENPTLASNKCDKGGTSKK